MSNLFGYQFVSDTQYASTSALAAVDMTNAYNGGYAWVTDTGVYQYSKQATTGDLAATGGGYWNAVPDLPCLLLNSSNEIDGSQITAVGVISLANGTAAAPAIYWTADTNMGFYRIGADNLGVATAGTLRLDVSTTAITSTLPIVYPAGSAAAPSMTFASDLNCGLYQVAADNIGFSTGGTLRLDVSSTAVTSTIPVVFPAGAAATPAVTFVGDLNTGIYSAGADQMNLSTGGTLRVSLSTTALTSTVAITVPDGSAAAPGLRVTSEASGMYLVGAGSLGLSVAGTVKANLTATAFNIPTGSAFQINATQVVGPRATGWVTFAGTGTTNQGAINVDTFTATDANIRLLGQGVKGMLDALILHGLVGA